MTLDEYMNSLRGVSVAVVGLGVSNRPLLRLLLAAGAKVTVRDKKLGEEQAAALEAQGWREVWCYGMGAGLEAVQAASSVEKNLVVAPPD